MWPSFSLFLVRFFHDFLSGLADRLAYRLCKLLMYLLVANLKRIGNPMFAYLRSGLIAKRPILHAMRAPKREVFERAGMAEVSQVVSREFFLGGLSYRHWAGHRVWMGPSRAKNFWKFGFINGVIALSSERSMSRLGTI